MQEGSAETGPASTRARLRQQAPGLSVRPRPAPEPVRRNTGLPAPRGHNRKDVSCSQVYRVRYNMERSADTLGQAAEVHVGVQGQKTGRSGCQQTSFSRVLQGISE